MSGETLSSRGSHCTRNCNLERCVTLPRWCTTFLTFQLPTWVEGLGVSVCTTGGADGGVCTDEAGRAWRRGEVCLYVTLSPPGRSAGRPGGGLGTNGMMVRQGSSPETAG